MKNGAETSINTPSLEKDLEVVCGALRRHVAPRDDEAMQEMNQKVHSMCTFLLRNA